MKYNLVKCHGCGNDFVIINGFITKLNISDSFLKRLIAYLTDRSGPIGADGVIYVESSAIADAKAVFFNPNGNRTKMCLNGIRCVARFVFDSEIKKTVNYVEIETDAGAVKIKKEFDSERNMFFYVVDEIKDIDFISRNVPINIGSECVANENINFLSEDYLFSGVKVYTPHLITVVDKVDEKRLYNIGIKANENLNIFPDGMNVSFVKIIDKKNLFVRTFERDNIGMSLSCSSAMVASVCVLIKLKYIDTNMWINVYNKGGLLKVKCKCANNNEFCVTISGPATIVYTAEMEIDDVETSMPRYDTIREDDVSGLKIINGNVNLQEINKYNEFLSRTRIESKESEFLLEMS